MSDQQKAAGGDLGHTDPAETIAGRGLSSAERRLFGETPVAKLQLSRRASAVASYLRVKTVTELATLPLADLLRLPNCGLETISELRLRVSRTIDSHAHKINWDDSIGGQPLTEAEMKALRETPVDEMRLTPPATEVATVLRAKCALDLALAPRKTVCRLGVRRASHTVRQFELALWRIIAQEERQAKRGLRETLKTLRSKQPPTVAHDGAKDDAVAFDDEPTHQTGRANDGSVYDGPLNAEEERICRTTPVGVLGLSVRAGKVAKALGLETALDVARAGRDELAHVKNCGRATIREFRSAVVRAIEDRNTTVVCNVEMAGELKENVDRIVSTLDDSRSELVLQKRFGMWDGDKTTLEGVAGALGLTRERIRQIETKAIGRLRGSLSSRTAFSILTLLRGFYLDPIRCPSFAGVLTAADVESLMELRSEADGPQSAARAIALRFLLSAFDDDLKEFTRGLAADSEDRWFGSESAAERFKSLESEIRTILASRGRPVPIDDLVKRLCASGFETSALELKRLAQVSREIGLSAGELALRNWNRFRRGRAAAGIERALAELGKPTHYSYIVEKMNFMLPDKAPFVGHAITATMLRYPDVFVSLGRGMYALRNWGISRPPYVKDFVIDSMRRAGGQATIEYVAELGAKKHGFKQSSIAMTMTLNPTFFRHVRGTLYRLL